MANRIKKTKIIKENLKAFNREIEAFNKRLKTAEKKEAIDNKTYKMLMIDKDKKDFYRANIFNKRQFKQFISNLKKGNKETFKKGRDVKKLGSIVNELAQTKYEKMILKQQLNKTKLLESTFGQQYKDILINVATNESKTKRIEAYDKLFNRYLKMDYDIPNKASRYLKTLEEWYEKRFGTKADTKGLTLKDIEKLSKLATFDLKLISDPTQNERDVKDQFDELLKNAKKGVFKEWDEEINE